jgi:hypothetical protein
MISLLGLNGDGGEVRMKWLMSGGAADLVDEPFANSKG